MGTTHKLGNISDDSIYNIGHADRIEAVTSCGKSIVVEFDINQIAENSTIIYQAGSPYTVRETEEVPKNKQSVFKHLLADLEMSQSVSIRKIYAPEYLRKQLSVELPVPVEHKPISQI